MVFSTPVFLFLFLPTVLALYCLCPARGRNLLLLAASLLFYAWGAQKLVLVMMASITANWLLGIAIDRLRGSRWSARVLWLTVAVNLAPLLWFKYTTFLVETASDVLSYYGLASLDVPDIVLPIGISFFTFQAMSYVIDVYRGDAPVQRNPINLALYIALFPQLVAGPIVRYLDVAAQIDRRRVTLSGFAVGAERFMLGMAKKVLLANSFAPVADSIFDIPGRDLTMPVAWLGVVCYTLQIYFDFSGYSDMAIGLGRMFGFRFVENFNYPYVARSISDFWRRWHISLSTWFRDYLYIPLGGNRSSAARTYANLLIVFFLCGLWHGASWNFVAWGLFHGAFLVIERRGLASWLTRTFPLLAHLYTIGVVMFGWVLFRAGTLTEAGTLLAALCGFATGDGLKYFTGLYLDTSLMVILAAGGLLATPLVPIAVQAVFRWVDGFRGPLDQAVVLQTMLGLGRAAVLSVCLLATAIALSASTYNPFIYFQF